MKLKCVQHDRRVLTVPGSSNFLHRTGDMSKCESKTAVLRDNTAHTTRQFAIRNGALTQTLTHKE
jgi:hypothetical protein